MPTKFIIVVDDLRVGGIQRLAFDECYAMMEKGVKSEIFVLNTNSATDSMIIVDGNYFKENNIDIEFSGTNQLFQLFKIIKKLVKSSDKIIFISHSPTGVFLTRTAQFLTAKNPNSYLWIHQFASLSDRKQLIKRFVYARFANKLYFGTKHFEKDWIINSKQNSILKLFNNSKINTDRIGVYVPRVKSQEFHTNLIECNLPHLIYASRLVGWKGFSKFLEIFEELRKFGFHAVIATANNPRNDILSDNLINQPDVHVHYDLAPASLTKYKNSVHLYPTNYGAKIVNGQSIGLNVLEFLSLGIPSIISKDSFESFPELRSSKLIYSVDWKDINSVISVINSLTEFPIVMSRSELEEMDKVSSIKSHVNTILELGK
jgi:glycosyltransferase involved in cell wall biosynthesis